MLVVDAQTRLDAAERAVTFSAEEREVIGPVADRLLENIRLSSLVQSLFMSADVRTFSVEVYESNAGTREVSINEESPPVVVVFPGSWHPAPVALPAFGGITMIVGALFAWAVRWRRPARVTGRN